MPLFKVTEVETVARVYMVRADDKDDAVATRGRQLLVFLPAFPALLQTSPEEQDSSMLPLHRDNPRSRMK